MSTLERFVSFSKPVPKAVATSQEITDRDSVFAAAIYRASNATEAQDAIRQHTNVVHGQNKASHEMTAWRCMALKPGRDGLGGPDDFQVQSGSQDDGEDYGGQRTLKVMQAEGVLDAVVIVSRWYGGTMLGPVRFTHIENCAREVCRAFKAVDEIEACVEDLKQLDEQLVQLRSELAKLSAPEAEDTNSASSTRRNDYSTLLDPPDIPKAKRLITARQNAIKSVNGLLLAKRGSK